MAYRKLLINTLQCLVALTVITSSLTATEPSVASKQKASEQPEPFKTEKRMDIGTMSMPKEEKEAITAKREIAIKEALAEKGSNDDNEEKETSNAYFSGAYCNHPGTFHKPYYVTSGGDFVTIEDGSIWQVYGPQAYATLNWFTTDTIVIVQNNDLLSLWPYQLVNQNTGVVVDAALYAGPIYGNKYTLLITATDSYQSLVYLSDGTVWQIPPSDDAYLNSPNFNSRWIVGNAIILGSNNGYYPLSWPSILINVNTNNYAYAVRVL